MRPEIIIMLTHHDVTVKNAAEVFEQCKDIEEVKFWGFKNVGLPKDEMKALAGAMKAAGKTTFLEVVTYDTFRRGRFRVRQDRAARGRRRSEYRG